MRKFITSTLAVLMLSTGLTAGTSEAATSKAPSYRAQVVKGTILYGPCKAMRKTSAGRIAYRDMIADNTDDGKRRSVKSQVRYVRQGCRNGV